MQNVKLYDTTLRDGTQTEGMSLSVKDKLRILERLDEFGIHYVEGGWPGSNPKDMEFFHKASKLKLKNAKLVAFSSTKRPSIKPSQDQNIAQLLKSTTRTATIFGKAWDLHVADVLKTTLEENLNMIKDTIKYLKSRKFEVFFDAEHFFDGYISNPDYAVKVLRAAENAGASCVILCDTNGGTITSSIEKIIRQVRPKISGPLGIHCHNDCEMAVSNSVAAVELGAQQVQGTINGYGERCGNANLISIIGILKLKLGIKCLPDAKLKEMTEVSRFVAEVCNFKQQNNQPFTGESAFSHKAGVHVNAVMKNPRSYEHVEPAVVGNKRKFLVSELSGKSSIEFKAQELAMGIKKDNPKARKFLYLLQDLEHKGYHFEAAEGSLELLMKRAIGKLKKFFELEGFRIIMEKKGDSPTLSEATIKIKVKDLEEHTAAKGDGPVNALDNALRKALEEFYPSLKEMHLSDFKVRVIDEKAGTAAKVRVLIQSHDLDSSWWTVGVSENIIEASWQALVDSVEYKLLKDLKARK